MLGSTYIVIQIYGNGTSRYTFALVVQVRLGRSGTSRYALALVVQVRLGRSGNSMPW